MALAVAWVSMWLMLTCQRQMPSSAAIRAHSPVNTILGWPLQILALLLVPLVVVQPSLAAGLLVLLIAGQRMLGEHAGRREWLAVAAIIVGVAGIAAVAPDRTTAHTDRLTLVLVLSALGAAATLPYLLRRIGHSLAGAKMLGAGFGFAWSAIATKLLADAASNGHWVTALGWALGSGVASGLAVISEMSALQVRPDLPVFLITGRHEMADQSRAQGISGLFCKPFDGQVLLAAVADALRDRDVE